MTEVPVMIYTDNGTRETLAQTWPWCPGLGLTRDPTGAGWTVTHLGSGHRIRRAWKHRRDALALLSRVSALTDWTQPRDVLQDVPGLQLAVDSIVRDIEDGA